MQGCAGAEIMNTSGAVGASTGVRLREERHDATEIH